MLLQRQSVVGTNGTTGTGYFTGLISSIATELFRAEEIGPSLDELAIVITPGRPWCHNRRHMLRDQCYLVNSQNVVVLLDSDHCGRR